MESMKVPSEDQAPAYLKGGPLYAFSLPQELLQVIQVRSSFGNASGNGNDRRDGDEKAADSGAVSEARGDGSALRCSLCGIAQFESIGEQRAHFSSDWHRYNIKRSLSDKAAVKEQEWESMVDGEYPGTSCSRANY